MNRVDLIIDAKEKGHELVILDRNSKVPNRKDWPNRNPEAHEVIWNVNKFNANFGLKLNNIIVADKDAASRKAYDWMRLRRIHKSPMEVTTKKGVHFYFGLPDKVCEDVRTKIKFLGLPLDLLTGSNRFVVGPGSEVDGFTYSLREGCEITAPGELPIFPVDVFETRTEATKVNIMMTFNMPDERAKRYIDKIAPSVQGQNGSRAFFVACLKILNLTDGDIGRALALLSYYNATRCFPPFEMGKEDGPDSGVKKLRDAAAVWKPK